MFAVFSKQVIGKGKSMKVKIHITRERIVELSDDLSWEIFKARAAQVAKTKRREQGLQHIVTLDWIAKVFGFTNWALLSKNRKTK